MAKITGKRRSWPSRAAVRAQRRWTVATAGWAALILLPAIAIAQTRMQWPSAAPLDTTPVFTPPPNASLGPPVFDPFSTAPPQYQAPAPVLPAQQWPTGTPLQTSPLLNGTEPFPAQNQSALFPNGVLGYQQQPGLAGPSMRFLQAPRLRHAWLHGSGGDELQINETDVSLVFAWPNYLFSQQPLYVVPSFSLVLLDGPDAASKGSLADLPGSVYGAYLDTGWESSPDAQVGGEIGTRVGVFSDFNTFTTDSIRIQGKGLLRLRVTPTVQLRGGVYYVDRLKIKLLPAGGLLWTPNPQTRFDIYFPQPKLAQYMTTVGNTEFWWYIAGEYGGGSWTIKRAVNGLSEQMDLNDIRLMMGIEWGASRFFARGRRVGFFEAGWVTDREILYRKRPIDNLELDDTFMLRGGIAY
ncbi:MAG: hypothetical protein KDB14_28040 [Planctomycetales bacterium]|nr:hypothetical protein [Planctomycetales bacterium]